VNQVWTENKLLMQGMIALGLIATIIGLITISRSRLTGGQKLVAFSHGIAISVVLVGMWALSVGFSEIGFLLLYVGFGAVGLSIGLVLIIALRRVLKN
jgi:hypothetical protein